MAAHLEGGFPLTWSLSVASSMASATVLFLLPFAQSISFGNLLKFEAKVEQVQSEVASFKGETRNILNLHSTMISSVNQSVAQNTTVNLPPLTDAYSAEKLLSEHSTNEEGQKEDADAFGEYLASIDGDPNLALAKLRMELEIEFRRILGKRSTTGDRSRVRFMSLRQLWTEFIDTDVEKRYLIDGLQFVNNICNAAIHGQRIPIDHSREALSIGLRILGDLKNIP